MKIGIIGAGNIAGTMATTLQPLKGAECYAIASRDIKRSRAFADKYGFERAYGSYADMLSDPYVELVYIATPHSHHYEHIKMCLNHGKHVLCEKAFCANATQAEEVLRMGEEMGLLVAEAIWTRYMPMRSLINKVLKSGIIGNPTSLSANLGYPLIHKSRMVRPELAGGALLDLGVYVLNFASMIFGDDIDSIAANCVKLDTGVDAQENIMLTYRDGRMASLYATMLAQTDRRGLVNGTNGYIEIENINNYEMVRVYNLERKIVAEYTAPTQITGYEYEVQSAMRAIREGRIECPEMPHAQILRMMQLMDSIRSAWGIEFPFERDNTIRITTPGGRVEIDRDYANAAPFPEQDDEPAEKTKSVVRKISEKSVSDTEYENTEKPKARNAKDARDMLPPSPHKGITDKLPQNVDFAKPAETVQPAEQPHQSENARSIDKVHQGEKAQPVGNRQIDETPVDPEQKIVDTIAGIKAEELEAKVRQETTRRKEAQIRKVVKVKKSAPEEDVAPSVPKEVMNRDKSPTEKIRDLGMELSAENEPKNPGSVTDQIRGLVIDEHKPDDRSITGKLRDLDSEMIMETEEPGFQRKRQEFDYNQRIRRD